MAAQWVIHVVLTWSGYHTFISNVSSYNSDRGMGCVQNDGFQSLVFRCFIQPQFRSSNFRQPHFRSCYIQWNLQLGHRYAKQWSDRVLSSSRPSHWIWTMFRICYDYARHVRHSCRLQSTTTVFQYFQGYKCMSFFCVESNHNERPGSDFPYFLPNLSIRWCICFGIRRPSISHYLLTLLRLQMWEYRLLVLSPAVMMRN